MHGAGNDEPSVDPGWVVTVDEPAGHPASSTDAAASVLSAGDGWFGTRGSLEGHAAADGLGSGVLASRVNDDGATGAAAARGAGGDGSDARGIVSWPAAA